MIERGLAPVAVGLIVAGVLTLMRAEGVGPLEWATLLACTAWLARGGSPYIAMAAAAGAYAGLLRLGLIGA